MIKPFAKAIVLDEALAEIKNIKKLEQAEVLVFKKTAFIIRFSENQLTQSTWEENNQLSLRVVKKKQIGFASSNQLTAESLKNTVEKAVSAMEVSPPLEDFVSLPEEENLKENFSFVDPELKDFKPEKLSQLVQSLFEQAEREKTEISGSITHELTEIGVANSLGVYKTASFTELYGSLIAEKNGLSGYASFLTRKKSELNLSKIYRKATLNLEIDGPPKTLPPGEYTVVLSSEATAELIDFLSYLGFSALAYQEGRSFMKPGEKMVSSAVTIWDDGKNLQGFPLPFDFEGITKQKISLIEEGVATGLAYDSYTAHRENKKSTGHALPYPNSTGPLPLNLFLEPGETSLEDLIASTKKGVFVTRFFYVNPMNPLKTIITGMTRDGTYLIENGRLTQPLKNLRFIQSILDAFSEIEMVAKEVEIKKPLIAYCSAPALKIKKLNFTGVSES